MASATESTPVVMLVDMDAFYASVELRRRPELKDRPMWVGGADRGVVLSANYPARALGVHGGMSSAKARRLCPHAVSLPPDFSAYSEVSAAIVAILEDVCAWVDRASIDEAYLDLTGPAGRGEDPAVVGERVRSLIREQQGISCTVGIGPNRLIAKMAANSAKPDGLRRVRPEGVAAFLWPQPVSNLVGIGPSTAARLHRLGILTVADLAEMSLPRLQQTFGAHAGRQLAGLAAGKDSARWYTRPGERSVGCQETLARDLSDPAAVRAELLRLAVKVTWRMRKANVVGRVVTLGVRFPDFTSRSRSHALPHCTDLAAEVQAVAMALFDRLVPEPAPVRRLGIRMTGLAAAEQVHRQPALDPLDADWEDAEAAVEQVMRRFGSQALRRAVLTGPRGR